jgi:transposase
MQSNFNRFIGLDIHKKTATFVIMNGEREVIKQGKFAMGELVGWAKRELGKQDQAVIETTGNGFYVKDQISAYAGDVVVADAFAMHDRTRARRKTDKTDAHCLAEALASGFVAEVWVPPMAIREKRALATHRYSLTKGLTTIKTQMRALLYQHGIEFKGDMLSQAAYEFITHNQDLSAVARSILSSKWRQGHIQQEEAIQLDKELSRQCLQDETHLKLMTMPGIRAQAATLILAAIGDISRFDSPRKLASYAGLVPRVSISDERKRYGSITKQGRSTLRWIMVEAAQAATKSKSPLRDFYYRLIDKGKLPQVAVIALARKMLEIIWQMLTQNQIFKYVIRDSLAFKLRAVYNRAYGPCPNKTATTIADSLLGISKFQLNEA